MANYEHITIKATLLWVIPGQRRGKIPGVWLFPPDGSEVVRAAVGMRGHAVCVPSPMMHLPASAAPLLAIMYLLALIIFW